jgi:hypothetical protein
MVGTTIIANDSYGSDVSGLQSEYPEADDIPQQNRAMPGATWQIRGRKQLADPVSILPLTISKPSPFPLKNKRR